MSDDAILQEAPGAAFARWLAAGELRLQWCRSCERQIFYPRTLCPHCGDADLEWRAPSGKATVYSTTIVRQRPDRGGDYNVSIIQLSEGARLMSRVEGIAPADVRIGLAVEAMIGSEDGKPLLLFRPSHD